MKSERLTITKLADDFWQFNEANQNGPYVDAYLLIGTERALLVDSLQTEVGLFESVREITSLPIDVFVTHGHGDHAGQELRHFHEAGCRIYMNTRDYSLYNRDHSPEKLAADCFLPIKAGQTFSIGGRILEAFALPGHSMGGMALLDRGRQELFSGDAIGSGHFWMQIPGAMPLTRLLPGVETLYAETKKLPDLKVYPGHRVQSPVQLTGQYVKDVLTITRRLLAGIWEGEEATLDLHGLHMEYRHLSYGQVVDFCYKPETLFEPLPEPARESIKDTFTEKEYVEDGKRLAYMLFEPEQKENEKYPLVVFLHGAGERGSFTRLALANDGAINFAAKSWQEKHPCFVIAPQCPDGMFWSSEQNTELLRKIIGKLTQNYPIDACRIYMTGLSMGGMGTWNFISKYPRLIAAAMPICGAGDPIAVRAAKNVPVWAFHAVDDSVVPVTGHFPNKAMGDLVGTRQMVAALRGTGNQNVHYTEYPAELGYDHFSWPAAYADEEAKEWMFAQTRFDKYEIEWVRPGVWYIEDFNDDSMYLIEGKDKALVVDTGLGGGDFIGMLKSLTRLPLVLAITHAHGDHMLHADKFDTIYLSHKDQPLLDQMKARNPGFPVTMDQIIDIKDGDRIDLGGGVQIEVIELGGHTPGSVLFLDEAHGVCLTGDALGVWMQLPYSLPLSEYRENLLRARRRLSDPALKDLLFMGGHRRQEGLTFPYGDEYKPTGLERFDDTITLCGLILNDEIDYSLFPMARFGKAYAASYHNSSIVFNDAVKK